MAARGQVWGPIYFNGSVTWTKAVYTGSPATVSLNAVAWTGTWWAAFGYNGASLISSDGATWLKGDYVTNVSFFGAVGSVGPRGLVVVGDTGSIATAEK